MSLGRGRRPARRTFYSPEITLLEDRCLLAVNVNPSSTFPGQAHTGVEPPDTILAAGPSSVLEAVNTSFAFYGKDGTAILSSPMTRTFPSNTLSLTSRSRTTPIPGRLRISMNSTVAKATHWKSLEFHRPGSGNGATTQNWVGMLMPMFLPSICLIFRPLNLHPAGACR
jgi:hypothetical protein